MKLFKAIAAASAVLTCSMGNLIPAEANPQMGKVIIRDQYSTLMQVCNTARVLNGNGGSDFSDLARNTQIGSYISAGYSSDRHS